MSNSRKSLHLIFKKLLIFLFLVVQLSNPLTAKAEGISDLVTSTVPSAPVPPVDKVISVDHNKQQDKKIEKRLQMIYSELDDLKTLKVSVSNGIATLEGEVESKASIEKAIHFANQMEDVVEVENKLTIKRSLTKRLQTTLDKLIQGGEQLIAGLPIFLLAVLVFYLFWSFGGWLSSRQNLFRKMSSNYFIADLVGKLVHAVFVIIGLVLALSLMDATALLGTILGAAGIFGIAIGIAVRDTVENFIATILLSIRNPFEVNDFVDIEGHEGNVLRLTSRATVLISPDGNHIRIPNSVVFKAVIINYTRKPERRFDFDIGVAVNEDLSQVQKVVLQALQILSGVLHEPKPQVVIQELGDSNVVIKVYAWVNQNEHSLLKVRSEAIKTVKEALDKADISIPNPIYDLVMRKEKPVPYELMQSEDNKDKAADIARAVTTPKSVVSPPDAEEIGDTAVDLTLKQEIEKENIKEKGENLLSGNTSSEI